MSGTTEAWFEAPPLHEVAIDLRFAPLPRFTAAHVGYFWDLIRDEYPLTQEVEPLLAVEPDGRLLPPPWRRTWFLSQDGGRLVQLQWDRLAVNWRRRSPDDLYPSFETIYAAFRRHLRTLLEFVGPAGEYSDLWSAIDPRALELVYVNRVRAPLDGQGWLGGLFPDFRWRPGDRHLDPPAAFRVQFEFPRDHGARGVVHAATAIEHGTGEPFVELRISTSGPSGPLDDAGLDAWFDSAHEWVVSTFLDLTAAEAQLGQWKRRA